MLVHLGNVNTEVVDATEVEEKWLYNYLVFADAGARFSALFKSGKWDGLNRMYSRKTRKFPSGLLGLTKSGGAKAGHSIQVIDQRTFLAPDHAYQATWLDPLREQPQAYQACIDKRRGVVWAPTGSGKTEIMVALAHTIRGRWLICVPSIDLLDQTAARFLKRTGETVGVIGDGRWNEQRVTVATFQTLYRKLKLKKKDLVVRKFLDSQDGVMFDEAHTLPSSSFSAVPLRMPNASYRLGFSGTPLARGDQRNVLLIAHTGPVIYKIASANLIAAGVLSEPTIRFVSLYQDVPGFDWPSVYKAGVVESKARNALITRMAIKATLPALVVVKELAHGKTLERLLRASGLRANFVRGADTAQGRKAAIERLVRRDDDIIIATPIFDQGVDIPELMTVIIAGGGASTIRALQRLGRGMRVLPDGTKTTCTLWDVADAGNRWLRTHSDARKAVYVQAGYKVVDSQV